MLKELLFIPVYEEGARVNWCIKNGWKWCETALLKIVGGTSWVMLGAAYFFL